jgi:hypothetical protein
MLAWVAARVSVCVLAPPPSVVVAATGERHAGGDRRERQVGRVVGREGELRQAVRRRVPQRHQAGGDVGDGGDGGGERDDAGATVVTGGGEREDVAHLHRRRREGVDLLLRRERTDPDNLRHG